MDNQEEQKALSDNFFRMLVEAQWAEIFVCDAQGVVLYCNPSSENLLGRRREHIVGKDVNSLVEEGTIDASVTQEVMRTGKISTLIQGVPNSHSLLAIGVPIYNEDDQIAYIMTCAQDIEQLNNIKGDLVRKNKELMEQMETMKLYRNEFFSAEGLIFVGDLMENIINIAKKVAPIDVTVLILGETGVGKEGIAKIIHRMGKGIDSPFVKINCGMIPEHLFESELFGYEAGAFTGAQKTGKKGKIELARGGTLFLDEVGEMPLSMQVKLLEFLQDKSLVHVGGVNRIAVDTRIIAATNRDLQAMCEAGEFRWDLYYRLNVFPLSIPPLRERMEEMTYLAQFMLSKCNKKYHLNKAFDSDIFDALQSYNWSGNLRELEHVIERLYITADGNTLDAKTVEPLLGRVSEHADSKIFCPVLMPLKEAKAEVERQLLKKAFKQYTTTYQVAECLGVDQSTVVKLRKKHRM